jgi:hypothetical protein
MAALAANTPSLVPMVSSPSSRGGRWGELKVPAKVHAARILDISRRALYRLIEKYQLEAAS